MSVSFGSIDTSEIKVGDLVQQVAPIALGNPYEAMHVVGVTGEGQLVLSKSPDGPPLVDLDDRPMLYPRLRFRKLD